MVYSLSIFSGCSADGSVPGSGPGGRVFKSRHSDQIFFWREVNCCEAVTSFFQRKEVIDVWILGHKR